MVKQIIVTGPESSGKTTIVHWLNNQFSVFLVEEYARTYLAARTTEYTFEDLEHIATQQLGSMEAGFNQDLMVLSDTGPLVLKIWAAEKFGKQIPVVEHYLASDRASLYLLCAPDMPWEADPLREHPTDRQRLFDLYEQHLKDSALPYVVLQGNKENRQQQVKDLKLPLIERQN